jgi:hypothetical protein
MPSTGDDAPGVSVSEATAARNLNEIQGSVADFLDAMARFNNELNGDRPSAAQSVPDAVPRNVAYAVAEVARMLREAGADDDASLVDTAWLGLLAGDIDDLREHVALEVSARRPQ